MSIRAQLHELLGDDAELDGAFGRGGVPAPPRRLPIPDVARACPRGEVRPARDGSGAPVAVARLSTDEVCVVADRCPHDGGLLSDGFLEGDVLVCARHHWELDPRTGARVRSRCARS